MTKNDAFLHLNDSLPADIARRKEMGDLAGAIRLIDQRLANRTQPLLAPRLEAERLRLTRLPHDYPYSRAEALAMIRAEWPQCTEEQFDALVDHGRIDWRMVDGELRCQERFLESLRIYPREAPGLIQEPQDHFARDAVLAKMEAEGALTARITLPPADSSAGESDGGSAPGADGLTVIAVTPETVQAAIATLVTCCVSLAFQQWIVMRKIRSNPFSAGTLKMAVVIGLLFGLDALLPVLDNCWLDCAYRTAVVGLAGCALIYFGQVSEDVNGLLDAMVEKVRGKE